MRKILYIFLVAAIAAAMMTAAYIDRGYFAIGSEILIPMIAAAMLIKKEKRCRSRR